MAPPMSPVEKPTQADREAAAKVFDRAARTTRSTDVADLNRHYAKRIRAGEGDDFDAVQAATISRLTADQAARTTTTSADVDRPDGNELWEALFGILKGGVPEELTEDVCQQLVEALASPFTTTIEGVRAALEPVMHWYQSDEHEPRPLHEIVADVVADLQQDRATVLRAARTTTTEVSEARLSHPREGVRPAYSQAMVDLLDAYEQRIWVWAQGCEIDGIQQRSVRGDSYNEGQRDDASKARSNLIRQIDALTWKDEALPPTLATPPATPAGGDRSAWPSDGTCRLCGSAPRSPATGLCASCQDEEAATPAGGGAWTFAERSTTFLAISDPGAYAGLRGQRTLARWQADAVEVALAALSPSPDAAPAGCTCVVAFGQDPSCPSHGRGTEWRAENPEADWRDDPAGARAALDLPAQATPSTPKDH